MSNNEQEMKTVAEARDRIADAINNIEIAYEKIQWMFERHPEWNSAIQYQTESATAQLGFILATLNNWWKD